MRLMSRTAGPWEKRCRSAQADLAAARPFAPNSIRRAAPPGGTPLRPEFHSAGGPPGGTPLRPEFHSAGGFAPNSIR